MSWGENRKDDEVVCSLAPVPTVYIEPIPRQKIELLMEKNVGNEWVGYLVGNKAEDGDIFVEDIVIPEHEEASGASAEVKPFSEPEGCVGILHSHNSMGAFHSVTDHDYVDRNYPVSITVSHTRDGKSYEYDPVGISVTPCGKKLQIKPPVKFILPEPMFDTEAFLKEAKENIDKGKKRTPVRVIPPRGTRVLYPRTGYDPYGYQYGLGYGGYYPPAPQKDNGWGEENPDKETDEKTVFFDQDGNPITQKELDSLTTDIFDSIDKKADRVHRAVKKDKEKRGNGWSKEAP